MTAEAGVATDSRALLIGVSAYEYAEFPPIRAARNSLMAMRAILADPELCGWSLEQITVISNPDSATELADHIADLAENATGALLLYYVGHGVLTTRGELCLTVTSTRPTRPQISGLTWETIADVLRLCPARVRLVILDCCFAGQANESLSGDISSGLADTTHVEGVYTLTATTRNRTAHVPPPEQQEAACTSFTGELHDLVRLGIPGGPQRLAFGDIYPVLRQRLRAKGLPTPSQRGTDTAYQFPFTVNAATHVQDRGHAAGEAAQTLSSPVRVDLLKALRLLDDAERIARSMGYERQGESARAEVAEAMAVAAPDRAERLARSLGPSQVADIAKEMAATDPDRAERLARSITDKWYSRRAMATVAKAIAATNPDRAERLARSITDEWQQNWAVAVIAEGLAVSDPRRAENLAGSITYSILKTSAFVNIARALTASDPERTVRLLVNAEQAAQSIKDEEPRALALADVAEALTASDPERATRLLVDAEHAAQSINAKWRKSRKHTKATMLVRIAEVMVAVDPDRAERLARSIADEAQAAWALSKVSKILAASDPDGAERLARSITSERSKASALANLAEVLAVSDINRAERIARSISYETPAANARYGPLGDMEATYLDLHSIWSSPGYRSKVDALTTVAGLAAVADPDRAELIARSIAGDSQAAQALTKVAEVLAATDPGRAERLAQSITDERQAARALTQVAEVLAASDPGRAEDLARSITIKQQQVSALVRIAKRMLRGM